MKIDTLILSGGGPSGIAYIGIFQALFDQKILDENLSGIDEIITTSVGILVAIPLLLKYNLMVLREILINFDLPSMLDIDNLSVNDLLFELGLFDTRSVGTLIESFIKQKINRDDMTLQELYEFNRIKLTVKVHNCSDQSVEYISHENYPDLSLITLAQMTVAVPIFFKPVIYREKTYCDGGLRGSFPIENCQSQNYLGLSIYGAIGEFKENDESVISSLPILPHLFRLFCDHPPIPNDPRIIKVDVGLGLNFEIDATDKIKIIENAYNITISHLSTIES